MKEKAPDEVLEYPETPPWTMFFDGPLYQKYDEFMKTKDFSKILLATKLRLANASEVQSSTNSIDDFQWDKQQEADPGSTYQYVPEDYYRMQDEDEKRRTRRTRAFILLGLVIMAVVALATGLVIHYIYIPSLEERNPVSNVNVSIFGNTSFGENIDETTTVGLNDNSALDLLSILSPDEHTHDHDRPHEHGPRLSPDGKIFEDLFMNITELPIDAYMETSTTVDETTKTLTKIKSHKIVTAAKTKTTPATTTRSKSTSRSSSSSSPLTTTTITTRKPTSQTTKIVSQTTVDNALYDIHIKPNTASAKQQTKPDAVISVKTNQSLDNVKPISSTMDIDAMDFFAMREYFTTTFGLPKAPDAYAEVTKLETTKQATNNYSSSTQVPPDSTKEDDLISNTESIQISSSAVTNFTFTAANETESMFINSTTIETTTSTISRIPSTMSTSLETSTDKGTENPLTGTSEPSVPTEDPLKPTQTGQVTVGLNTKVDAGLVTEAVHMAAHESTREMLATDAELTPTTTMLPETTTLFLPENFNSVYMQDVTTFTFDNATIDCSVKHAIKWQSLSIKINRKWLALEVTLLPSGIIKWSRSKSKRHAVIYDVKNSTDGYGSNVTLRLVINDVQCQDANTFMCILKSNVVDRITQSQFIVVGKPSDAIHLTLGPSIIEDQAFRITASWQGGYPIPWTNMSWTAIDKNNKSYNLADYGEYRDYELHVDDKFCQTTLSHSIVVFPKVHLNDTTVIVKPDIEKKQRFVDKSMERYLYTVQPGVEKILVLPLNYCKSDNKEESIRHPYTPCSKYVRCLPNNLVVQQCPTGTCFFEKRQQCA